MDDIASAFKVLLTYINDNDADAEVIEAFERIRNDYTRMIGMIGFMTSFKTIDNSDKN